MAAAAALWQNVDINSLARQAAAVVDAPPPLTAEREGPNTSLPGLVQVALYGNSATESYFPDSTHLAGVLAKWQRTLSLTPEETQILSELVHGATIPARIARVIVALQDKLDALGKEPDNAPKEKEEEADS